jgi:hypothetical protein
MEGYELRDHVKVLIHRGVLTSILRITDWVENWRFAYPAVAGGVYKMLTPKGNGE